MSEFGCRCQTEKVLKHLLSKGILSEEQPCGLFIDRAVLLENMNEIKEAFPEPFFKHRYAIKANPIKKLIRYIGEHGFGVECASFEEVPLAVNIYPSYPSLWNRVFRQVR